MLVGISRDDSIVSKGRNIFLRVSPQDDLRKTVLVRQTTRGMGSIVGPQRSAEQPAVTSFLARTAARLSNDRQSRGPRGRVLKT